MHVLSQDFEIVCFFFIIIFFISYIFFSRYVFFADSSGNPEWLSVRRPAGLCSLALPFLAQDRGAAFSEILPAAMT